ncbi:MAG: hypothetical protein QXK45_03860 [Thermofilaceae archaeon]
MVDGEARKRDGRPFDLSGYSVYLVLRRGARRLEVPGGLTDAPRGHFQVTLSRELTSSLEPGTWNYELGARNADGSVDYVFDVGQVDVLPRL